VNRENLRFGPNEQRHVRDLWIRSRPGRAATKNASPPWFNSCPTMSSGLREARALKTDEAWKKARATPWMRSVDWNRVSVARQPQTWLRIRSRNTQPRCSFGRLLYGMGYRYRPPRTVASWETRNGVFLTSRILLFTDAIGIGILGAIRVIPIVSYNLWKRKFGDQMLSAMLNYGS